MSRVDVQPLQDAFLANGCTASAICRRIGWLEPDGKPEITRLRRTLGLKPYWGSKGLMVRQQCSPANAMLIGAALGLDPHEVGV